MLTILGRIRLLFKRPDTFLSVSEYQKKPLTTPIHIAIFLIFRNTEPSDCPMADFQDSETRVDSLKDLGLRIRQQRRASKLRIDDAAALCGVSVDLLSRLENGRSGVSSDRILRVLDGLGLMLIVASKTRRARKRSSEPTPTKPDKS